MKNKLLPVVAVVSALAVATASAVAVYASTPMDSTYPVEVDTHYDNLLSVGLSEATGTLAPMVNADQTQDYRVENDPSAIVEMTSFSNGVETDEPDSASVRSFVPEWIIPPGTNSGITPFASGPCSFGLVSGVLEQLSGIYSASGVKKVGFVLTSCSAPSSQKFTVTVQVRNGLILWDDLTSVACTSSVIGGGYTWTIPSAAKDYRLVVRRNFGDGLLKGVLQITEIK